MSVFASMPVALRQFFANCKPVYRKVRLDTARTWRPDRKPVLLISAPTPVTLELAMPVDKRHSTQWHVNTDLVFIGFGVAIF